MEYYIEKEKIQKSHEGQAYEQLSESLNSTCWRPTMFAKASLYEHPTLQQCLIRTMVATINELANVKYIDARNENGINMCRKLVESGLLDEYLPYI